MYGKGIGIGIIHHGEALHGSWVIPNEVKLKPLHKGLSMQLSDNIRQQVLSQLKDFYSSHGADYSLLSLGIFGSVARGEAHDMSDVDVVFETDRPNLLTTSSLKLELERLLSKPVDIVRLREQMNPRLKERIIRDAVFV